MAKFLSKFMEEVEENNVLVLYAQVYKDGKMLDLYSRFGKITTGLSAFSGVSRVESYSAAKSFSAAGVGIAIDEGLISLEEKVADSYPELTYDINNPYALDITVEDMLKMSSGLADPLFFRDSPERATVNVLRHPPRPKRGGHHSVIGGKRLPDFQSHVGVCR